MNFCWSDEAMLAAVRWPRLGSVVRLGRGSSTHAMADVFSDWQAFEMCYLDQISRAATVILQDLTFQSLLLDADSTGSAWSRDAAGIVIRLLALSYAGVEGTDRSRS
mmetsp:Transcript_11107/g.34874  ORF Transcript_11107/g.34874 Transcript_11107/m.34874 type:complete len:107 (+) Transcript_11107:411-731(+)